jgi:hypothetical protein
MFLLFFLIFDLCEATLNAPTRFEICRCSIDPEPQARPRGASGVLAIELGDASTAYQIVSDNSVDATGATARD